MSKKAKNAVVKIGNETIIDNRMLDHIDDIDDRITRLEKTVEALTDVLSQARTSGGHITIGSHELRTAVKNRVVLDLIDRGEDI